MVKYVLIAAVITLSTPAFAIDSLNEKIIGKWCLNTEEYDGDISVDGSIWEFKTDGTYVYTQAYVSKEPYSIEGDSIKLAGLGTMKVLSISKNEMT